MSYLFVLVVTYISGSKIQAESSQHLWKEPGNRWSLYLFDQVGYQSQYVLLSHPIAFSSSINGFSILDEVGAAPTECTLNMREEHFHRGTLARGYPRVEDWQLIAVHELPHCHCMMNPGVIKDQDYLISPIASLASSVLASCPKKFANALLLVVPVTKLYQCSSS